MPCPPFTSFRTHISFFYRYLKTPSRGINIPSIILPVKNRGSNCELCMHPPARARCQPRANGVPAACIRVDLSGFGDLPFYMLTVYRVFDFFSIPSSNTVSFPRIFQRGTIDAWPCRSEVGSKPTCHVSFLRPNQRKPGVSKVVDDRTEDRPWGATRAEENDMLYLPIAFDRVAI